MTWKDIAKKVASAAPLLGSLLAGPAGGTVGTLIASALGTDKADPQEVFATIAKDSEALLKLKQLEKEHELELRKLALQAEAARLAEETKRIQTVNETMRIEAQADDAWQRRWRPFWGFATAILFNFMLLCLSFSIIISIVGGRTAEFKEVVTTLTPLVVDPVFWAVPTAVLGISAWSRGKEKQLRLRLNKNGESI